MVDEGLIARAAVALVRRRKPELGVVGGVVEVRLVLPLIVAFNRLVLHTIDALEPATFTLLFK